MEKLTIPFRRWKRLAGASGAQIPFRLAAALRDSRRPCSSTQIQSRGAKRKYLPFYSWGAKRVRSALGGGDKQALSGRSLPPPLHTNNSTCTDWANLGDGPAGLIADFALASDLADYVRFRAACRSWRRCSLDPRAGGLDGRFLPRQWIMLDKALDSPRCRRFFNISTGECIRMDLPELAEHTLLTLTPEGLLLLLHEPTLVVRLLNPLTRQLTDLPPMTGLLTPEQHLLRDRGIELGELLLVYGTGLVADGATVAVSFCNPRVLAVAKPGDKSWTLVDKETRMYSVLPFAGRFYCASYCGVMVLNFSSDQQPPRLLMVAERSKSLYFSVMTDSLHLVDNGGELMLVHRMLRYEYDQDHEYDGECDDGTYEEKMRYEVYTVDLDAGILIPLKGLNGRAVFMGMRRAISVSADDFPSVTPNTIYLGVDCDREFRGYNVADGSKEPRHCCPSGPCTAVDCLRFCIHGRGNQLD